jgi:hypothetical protein
MNESRNNDQRDQTLDEKLARLRKELKQEIARELLTGQLQALGRKLEAPKGE